MLQVNSQSKFPQQASVERALSLMRLTSLLLRFEESEDALSPATVNDAVNAFLDSPEQGHFEEHCSAALHD
jgi:hypothetical protein